ncbi:hypothetical protein MKX41_10630 [Paenibacillus sp. FSL R5-0475]|uniref:hypothetical protein n=1 Tax=Paenibacillus sp. FSL R5-0475 TaxID=2921643 RepID=UPI0030F9FDDA
MNSDRKIRDDEGYEITLKWMVEKSKLLLDPLTLSPVQRKELQMKYDFWEQRIHEYNRGQMVLLYPELRKVYEAAGVKIQNFE